jgi:cell division protein FtsB
MEEKLKAISEKVDDLITLVEELRAENSNLTTDNRSLKTQVNRLKKETREASLNRVDKKDSVKNKLYLVLNRLEELESLTG